MNRRGFLKSFSALAAAAVAGPALATLVPTDQERLVAAMRTGLIENQTFVFYEPVTFGMDNLIVRNCHFIFKCPTRMKYAVTLMGSNLLLDICHFDCGPNGADAAIYIPENLTGVGITLPTLVNLGGP